MHEPKTFPPVPESVWSDLYGQTKDRERIEHLICAVERRELAGEPFGPAPMLSELLRRIVALTEGSAHTGAQRPHKADPCDTPCPKCGSYNTVLTWEGRDTTRQHIWCNCERCSYGWAEAPLDALDGPESKAEVQAKTAPEDVKPATWEEVAKHYKRNTLSAQDTIDAAVKRAEEARKKSHTS